MSTIKADAVTAVSAGGDLSLDGLGTGGVSIASTLKMTKGGDISSASPLVIDTDGNYFDVTGTTNFSAMTVESGNFFMLQFDSALTITHGSGIELPGAANLTTATGDRLICYATAANTVEVMSVETEAAAAGGGAWNIIGTAVASNSASLTVTGLSSTYDTYAIALSDMLPIAVSSKGWIRLGDSGGIDVGTDYDYNTSHVEGTGYAATVGANTNQIELSEANVGEDTGEGIGGMLWLHRPGDGTMHPIVNGLVTQMDGTGATLVGHTVFGNRTAVITLDRVQFLFSGTNIESGRMTVWGIAHA